MSDFIASLTSKTSPLLGGMLPLAPVRPMSTLVSHLIATPVLPGYPVARLGAMHAARVAIIWAGLTKSKRAARAKKVGQMGDLFGYLVMCWGGGTAVPILLGQPPAWLLTPTPWLTYVPVYLLLIPTSLGEYIHSTCPTIVSNLLGAFADAAARGSGICAIPAALVAAGIPVTAWTTAVLGGIACTSGGILVQLLGLAEEDWRLGMPNILRGGVLNTLDFWGGMLAAVLYAACMRLTPELSFISDTLARSLPNEFVARADPHVTGRLLQTASHESARGLVVLFLVALFAARVITLTVLSPRPVLAPAKKMDKVDREITEAVLHEKVVSEDGPVTSRTRSRASTPKKSPSTPKKSPKSKNS